MHRKGSKRNVATNASVKFCRCNGCIRATKMAKYPPSAPVQTGDETAVDSARSAEHCSVTAAEAACATQPGGFRASRVLAPFMGAHRSGSRGDMQSGKTAARAVRRKDVEEELAEELAVASGQLSPAPVGSIWSDYGSDSDDGDIIEFELATGLDDDDEWLSDGHDEGMLGSLSPEQVDSNWPALSAHSGALHTPRGGYLWAGQCRLTGNRALSVVMEEAQEDGDWVVITGDDPLDDCDESLGVPFAEVVRGSL